MRGLKSRFEIDGATCLEPEDMKILALIGSNRKKGSTARFVKMIQAQINRSMDRIALLHASSAGLQNR